MRFSAPSIAALFVSAVALFPASPLTAQGDPNDDWDFTLARGETREIDFTTEEGTWMSMDISPDGRWVIFDMLAHVYRVPTDGAARPNCSRAVPGSPPTTTRAIPPTDRPSPSSATARGSTTSG